MLIDPEDRLSHEDQLSGRERRRGPSTPITLAAVAIIAVIGVGAGIYFSAGNNEAPAMEEPTPVAVSTVEPAARPALPPAPDIPTPEATPEPATEPLPEAVPAGPELTIENSDEDLRERLAPAVESPLIAQVLEAGDLVQRSAGMIDGLSRGLAPRKALSLTPLKQAFSTTKVDGLTYIDPAGYARYDVYVQAISSLNIDMLVSTFHRYRGLLEQAYQGLGYSGAAMDNALIRSLDYVLATPEPSSPIALQRKEAIFQYADPTFEQLSPLQKQILRMGPENTAKIKRQAAALRLGLLGGASEKNTESDHNAR